MRTIINKLIIKYIEYTTIILNLDIKTLKSLYEMSEEEAIKKLKDLQSIEIQKNEEKETRYLFYLNC